MSADDLARWVLLVAAVIAAWAFILAAIYSRLPWL